MNPAVMIFLLIALVGGCVKLILPRAFPPWEFVFVLLGVAAVLALDAIRAAIAEAFRPMAGTLMPPPPLAGGSRLQVGPVTVGPVTSQKSGQISQKSEKSGASSIGP